MTKEEILSMEPGPELDALVAEHVMGIESWNARTGEKVPYTTNHYSSDISAAWEVANKIDHEMMVYRGSIGYVVSFGSSDEECAECGEEPFSCPFQYASVNLPEAICKAALLAVLEATHDPS